MSEFKTLEAIYGVPDDVPMVQVFLRGEDKCLVAEIYYKDESLVIETCNTGILPVSEMQEIIDLARERLGEK